MRDRRGSGSGIVALLCLLVGSCGPDARIPREWVGTWAPEGTLLKDGQLVQGEVLYLTAQGTGFSAGSGPPPLGGSLLASYDERTFTLYLLPVTGQDHFTWERAGSFDPVRQVLVSARQAGVTYHRRSGSIPREVLQHRGPELWEAERTRLRDRVRAMNLYFPRIGYREMSPEEQIADQGNRFRREALDFLILSGEPPLSSLERDLEAYRLIWVGSTWKSPPFAVRVQRNRDGRVSVATSVDADRTGAPETRRRELQAEDWATLKERVEAARYFESPLRIGEMNPASGWWVVEGWRGGAYQYVEACDSGRGPYRELCDGLMGLGGLEGVLPGRK